jgi:hypothetical protein
MQSKHAKSPCCAARVRLFGPRRRQCVQCLHTWTVRPKKRGRRAHRTSSLVLQRVLLEGYTLGQLFSARTNVALPAYRYRFRQALHRFVTRTAPQTIPSGPLVLLVDGLYFEFEGSPWVMYLAALKPCCGDKATFLDPLLLRGREGATRWQQVIAAIPAEVRLRIQAIVADNLPGMRKLAIQQQWVLQLCHFHLLLMLMARRGNIRRSLRGGRIREKIHEQARLTLSLPDGDRFRNTIHRLQEISRNDCGTPRMQSTLREFLINLSYYRAYRTHPSLGLPITTNVVESMCRLIREMFRRNRAGSNPRSALMWATAFIRLRSTLVCNGRSFNRKD